MYYFIYYQNGKYETFMCESYKTTFQYWQYLQNKLHTMIMIPRLVQYDQMGNLKESREILNGEILQAIAPNKQN